ncbi:MAG: pyridoxamine 5'-phosphate oxidase family protein, partial [Bacillota bacterium]|nr:pyridoxamine 5'-phosphate oxidase family protein [Bacillota bacterium]
MRRSEKEITDKSDIIKILDKADIIRIAMVDDGEPYIVAMNFAHIDGRIYIHSAKEGRKIEALKKNNKIAFQTEIGAEVIIEDEACRCGARFMSVFGTGKATFIDDVAEKTKALDALMTKHTGKTSFQYDERVFERTLVIKIEIGEMTGK